MHALAEPAIELAVIEGPVFGSVVDERPAEGLLVERLHGIEVRGIELDVIDLLVVLCHVVSPL